MNRSTPSALALALIAAGLAGCAMDGRNMQAGSSAQQQVPEGGVRDWAAIDTNGDDLIQPAEMEVALREVGPQAAAAKK